MLEHPEHPPGYAPAQPGVATSLVATELVGWLLLGQDLPTPEMSFQCWASVKNRGPYMTSQSTYVGLMLVHRLRRWPNNKSTHLTGMNTVCVK